MMNRAVIPCLILICFVSDAFAGPMGQGLSQRLCLSDLIDIKTSRYFEGGFHSRFPKPERKLQVSPARHRDPLEKVYARANSYRYTVQPNDTLKKIARRHGTTVELVKALNKMTSTRVRAGQKLWVPDQAFTIEINKTLNRLYLRSGDELIKEYPVSTGKSEKQTPVGIFWIGTRYPFPTWFHKGVVVSAASQENYLGSRWLGFDKPQYGIHGTIFPELIGQSVSKGCVRMKNEDVEELYEFIPVGTTVVISGI
jgi:lipoprotein-anchoring transpeptidase ErfK/SrfK